MGDGIDLGSSEHEKARRMLETELIAWFTTVGADGVPHAVPVWFWWDGERAWVFSQPTTVKVKHVEAGSAVVLHLNAGGPFGDDVVILTGTAEVDPRGAKEVLAGFRDAYERKYEAAIADYGMPLDTIGETFSAALVFTPTKLQAW
jgi:PPOX class probable F420-dependent enzyme